jgi:hypothetical protein
MTRPALLQVRRDPLKIIGERWNCQFSHKQTLGSFKLAKLIPASTAVVNYPGMRGTVKIMLYL